MPLFVLPPHPHPPQPLLWHVMRGTNHIVSNCTTKQLQRRIYCYLRRKTIQACAFCIFFSSLFDELQPSSMIPALFFCLRPSSISPLALIAASDVARNRYLAKEWKGGAVRGADPSRHLCSCSSIPAISSHRPRLQQGQERFKGSAVGLEYTCDA